MRLLLVAVLFLPRQDPKGEVIAIVGARILTISKGDLARGVILIKNGKITEVASDAKIPDGATVIDGKGLVAMPGLVNPYSRITGGSGGTSQGSNPQVLAYDDLNPAADILKQLPRTGYTAIALYPTAGVTSGQAVAIKPVGNSREAMVLLKSCYLRFNMEATTTTKQQLRTDFETARKLLDGDKKAPTPAPSTPPPSTPAPAPTPAKPDERTEPLLRFLKGELDGIVDVRSAGEILHFLQVWKAFEGTKAQLALTVPLDSYKAAQALGERKATVIIRPEMTYVPFSRTLVNPAAELSKAGVTIVIAPSGDSLQSHEQVFFKVAELVKHGLDRGVALKALTLNGAALMGLEGRVGSLDVGKDADILLFDGDPLDPTSRLRLTMIDGKVLLDSRTP